MKFEIPSIILRNLLKNPSKHEIVLYHTICMMDKKAISPLNCQIAENLKISHQQLEVKELLTKTINVVSHKW